MTRSPDIEPDFRVRAAAKRRERMQARLLDAVMAVYAPDGRGEGAVVDDVVREAGVSRGTFYKYFKSLDAAVTEVGQRNADNVMRDFAQVFGTEDMVLKAIGGLLLALCRAAVDPRWASFTVRVNYVEYLARPTPLYAVIQECLAGGRAVGTFRFASLTAAADIAVGVAVQGTRRLANGERADQAYVVELAVMAMTALGMERAAAEAAAGVAWRRLVAQSACLPWWRPLARGQSL